MKAFYKGQIKQLNLKFGIFGCAFALYVTLTIVGLLIFKWRQHKALMRFRTNRLHLQNLHFPTEVYT